MAQLCPPFPSMTVMQFTPSPALRLPVSVPAGTLFESQQITLDESDAEEDVLHQMTCHFTQSRDLRVMPFTVSSVTADRQSVTVSFSLPQPVRLSDSGLPELQFYLGGDDYTAHELYFLLSHAVSGATLTTEKHTYQAENFAVSPAGFSREDALLPYPRNSYEGHRLLQEYFSFPRAFLFLNIEGLDDIPAVMSGDHFP